MCHLRRRMLWTNKTIEKTLLLYYLHHTGTPHHESTSLKFIAQLFKNCDNKFSSQVLGTCAQRIFSTVMSSWHFHNAFLVPCSICNQRVCLFFHPFICNFNTSTDQSHYMQTSCQTKQSVQIKTQCYQFKMTDGSTTQTNTQFFFIPEKALHFLQVQVALNKKCYRTSRTTPTNNIMNPAVPLGHGTIGKKEKNI